MPIFAALEPRLLGGLDYLALCFYFSLNLGIGWWCARRKRAASGDYFLGGGRVAWWAAAISFFATATSSISFMALPAKTYSTDWGVFLSAPAQGFAGIVVGLFFVNLLRKLGVVSIFAYLERRFDRRVQLVGAGLGVLLKVFGRMSVVMLLPSLALSTVTGLNVYVSIALIGVITTIYSLEGGFEAVIWTDVLQAAVMLGGVCVALWYLGSGIDGGLASLISNAQTAGKFNPINVSSDLTQPTVPVFLALFFATIFVQIGDQPLMQRMLSTATESEARRTVILGNMIGLGGSCLFFFVGTALWGFYQQHPDRMSAGLPNDAIFPYFIANELPRGVVGFIVAGLFAAAMGALSSILNSTSAVIVSDFQGALQPKATEAQRLRVAKWTTLLCGALGIGMASWLAAQNAASLWDEFLKLIALLGGGFAGVFALGLLTRRAHANGVIIGALFSIPITWVVQHQTALNPFAHGAVAVGSCMLIGYISSILLPSRTLSDKSLEGLTLWDVTKSKTAPGNRLK
jgi:solute:Na+ symporter, SSS family